MNVLKVYTVNNSLYTCPCGGRIHLKPFGKAENNLAPLAHHFACGLVTSGDLCNSGGPVEAETRSSAIWPHSLATRRHGVDDAYLPPFLGSVSFSLELFVPIEIRLLKHAKAILKWDHPVPLEES